MSSKHMVDKYRNFIFLEQRGFVFAYVPKVACTNWKCLFRLMNGGEDWLNPRLAHDRRRSGLRHLDLDRSKDQSILAAGDVKLYAMVRNPYSRILSAYLNKVMPWVGFQQAPKQSHFQRGVSKIETWSRRTGFAELDFRVFLLWLRDSGADFAQNEHFAPQTRLLRTGEVGYNYIGKIENLTVDARVLLKKMGCGAPFPSQQDVRFPPNNAAGKIPQFYGMAEARLVRELYRSDFEEFQYPLIP